MTLSKTMIKAGYVGSENAPVLVCEHCAKVLGTQTHGYTLCMRTETAPMYMPCDRCGTLETGRCDCYECVNTPNNTRRRDAKHNIMR